MKVILAFSGGLDTTFCIPYLQEKGYEVITVTVNTGGFTPQELQYIAKKSKDLGALNHIQCDAEEELYNNFVKKIIQANYLRGGTYPACVGPERIVAAQKIAEIAIQKNIKTIAHGSTGAGNDQVRFDLALRALIPGVEIIAPIRDESLSRTDEVNYLKKKGVPVSEQTKEYSINVGILGTTIGGNETKSTMGLPPDEIFPTVQPTDKTPSDPQIFTIEFKNGIPVAINDTFMQGPELIKEASEIAAKHGYGKDSHLGSTILGIKGRIVFEAPALKLMIKAHQELEKSVLTSKQLFWKNHLGTVWGDLIHEGLYFDPLVNDLEALIESSQKTVSGKVKLQLHKGTVTILGSQSQYSLLDTSIGTYGEENAAWTGQDAKGFCKLYGMEGVIAYQKKSSLNGL